MYRLGLAVEISTAQLVSNRARETQILREYRLLIAESTLLTSSQEASRALLSLGKIIGVHLCKDTSQLNSLQDTFLSFLM
jgi:hypothetical protein